MDPDDKLARLINESGLFNDENMTSFDEEWAGENYLNSSDEEWTPENFGAINIDTKLHSSGAAYSNIPERINESIYLDPSPSCSYDVTDRTLVINAVKDTTTTTEINKPKKLNCETGNFESDSEGSMQCIEENVTDLISKPNDENNNKKKLNYETGHFETDSEKSEEDAEKHTKKGKKRVAVPEKWVKNVAVKKHVKDHILHEINDCRCRCNKKLTKHQITEIHKKFINLENHTQQNIYLQGCLEEIVPKRFRPRAENKSKTRNRRVFKYFVTVKGKKIEVCQQAFLAVHGIKRDRLQCKVQHPEKDITDGRGRRPSRVVYTEDIINKIHVFIKNIPARASHYSRSSSKHRIYVDSHLSIAALHRDFLKQNPDINKIVTYEKFREVFNTDFNISFAAPRKDICSTCEKCQVKIQMAEIHKEHQKLKTLKTEHEVHLRKAEVFLKKYSSSEKENRNGQILSICFDFQKNLPLPVTNVTDEYYLRQLWLHNFGIHNLKENTATMYMFTENFAHKGPNEVITCLDDFFKNNKEINHTHLEIFCDNCFSQNKNRFIFTYLDQLCAKGIFETISVHYPIPGHSMMPIDRDFALIERQKLKHEKIYEPECYVNFVVNSRNTKKFEVVFLEKTLRSIEGEERVLKVKDYKNYYSEYIKQSVPGISSCRRALFRRHAKPQFSDSMTGDDFKNFSLYRVGISRYLRDTPDNCYQDVIKVKEPKINDVKKLLQYIPGEKRKFYDDLIREQEALREAQNGEENSEDDIE